jgi:CheY-like chemotaxis protein
VSTSGDRDPRNSIPPDRSGSDQAADQKAAQDRTTPSKYRVLLVEDNPLNQMLGKAMMEHCGCHVDAVGNGREAVEAFSRVAYDMIFMDCQMPEMDGFEATVRIRDLENRCPDALPAGHVPIVALTAYDTEGDREHCMSAGMDDYVGKPFNVATLQATIAKWCPGR